MIDPSDRPSDEEIERAGADMRIAEETVATDPYQRIRALELALAHHSGSNAKPDKVIATALVFNKYLSGDE